MPPDVAPSPLAVPAPGVAPVQEARTWRSVVGLVFAIGALAALSALFLFFPIDFQQIGRWGYLGVAAVVFVATASFALPIPYLLIVARAGTFLNPWLLGAVGGFAGMLGELAGYLVGFSGSNLVARGRWYTMARGWICTYGFWCIAFFACVPNPFFDAIGFAAGVLRYSVWRFALACFLGKAIKFLIAALIGEQAHLLGWLSWCRRALFPSRADRPRPVRLLARTAALAQSLARPLDGGKPPLDEQRTRFAAWEVIGRAWRWADVKVRRGGPLRALRAGALTATLSLEGLGTGDRP